MIRASCFFLISCLTLTSTGLLAQKIAAKDRQEAVSREEKVSSRLLNEYKATPLSLNEDSLLLLKAIGLVSEIQVETFVAYTKQHSAINSLDDLIVIMHWDRATIEKIRPCVKVIPSQEKGNQSTSYSSKTKVKKKSTLYWVPSRNPNKNHTGGAHQSAATFTVEKKDSYEFGLLGYKEKGEPYGYGYYRMYGLIEGKDKLNIKRIVIGKYNAKAGKGLILRTGNYGSQKVEACFAQSKELLNPCKANGRNQGLTGFGIHWRTAIFEGIIYAARNQYYATIYKLQSQATGADNSGYVRSIPQSNTGYRNETERQKKAGLKENLFGGTIIWRLSEAIQIGFQGLGHKYTPPLKNYKGYFSGKSNANIGCFFQAKKSSHQVIGEVAYSLLGQGAALLLGDKISFSKKNHIILLIQHYSPNFYALHGAGVGQCKGNNEQAITIIDKRQWGKSTLVNTVEAHRPVASDKKEKGYSLKYNLEHTYPLHKDHKLQTKFNIYYQPSKVNKTLKIASQYRYKQMLFNTGIHVVPNSIKKMVAKLDGGIYSNITYKGTPLTTTLHLNYFNTQFPLYFHTPDIKVPALFPKVTGQRVRVGVVLKYTLHNKSALQCQAYWTYGTHKDKPINRFNVKVRLVYEL